ncbi:MAG: hypothetical protein J0H49_07445 [Acidobacteria bacterium]|nr:hypothetical protein [Acidobacteriota bacterium]
MPFERPFPRSFTAGSIREHAPPLPGVYGLSNATEWLYIGDADNIQQALLERVALSGSANSIQRPTGFVFEVCDRARQVVRLASLILEYKPAQPHPPSPQK